jgi:hypothetical protein
VPVSSCAGTGMFPYKKFYLVIIVMESFLYTNLRPGSKAGSKKKRNKYRCIKVKSGAVGLSIPLLFIINDIVVNKKKKDYRYSTGTGIF